MTMVERSALVARAESLCSRHDFPAVIEMLADLSVDELRAEPALSYRLAFALVYQGEHARARATITRLHPRIADIPFERIRYRVLYTLATSHLLTGELEPAEEGFQQVVEYATPARDHDVLCAAANGMGIVAAIRCRWDAALAAYHRSLHAGRRTGQDLKRAAGHQNLGMAYRELGFLTDADQHLEEAIALYSRHGRRVAAPAEGERALLFLRRGDRVLARTTARRVFETLQDGRNRRQLGEALRILAITLAPDEPQHALELLRRALSLAEATGTRLLAAEIHEEMAILRSTLGDPAGADEALARSRTLYGALGADARARLLEERFLAADRR